MHARTLAHLAALFPLAGPALAAAPGVDPLPQLSATTHFPVRGATVTIDFEGPANAYFDVSIGFAPLEVSLGEVGTLFVQPAGAFSLANGFLSPAGTASVPLSIPDDPTLDDALFYVQGGVFTLQSELAVTNALAMRIGAAAPSGARVTEGLALAPASGTTGAKLYVAHRGDATLSIVAADTGSVLVDLPLGKPLGVRRQLHLDVAVDPEGRHAFVVDGAAGTLTLVDVATDSVAGKLAVGKGARRAAFDFGRAVPRVYVTQERDNQVLVFDELVPGFFVPGAPLPVAGDGPASIVVLPGGDLLVGNLASRDLERLDPDAAPGATTVDVAALGRIPHGLALVGTSVLVATFTPIQGSDGRNDVLRLDQATLTVQATLYSDLGTDYVDLAVAPPFVAVVASGTGTVLFSDATTLLHLARIELAPGAPTAVPQRAVFADPGSSGHPTHLFVANYFRETLRPITVSPPESAPAFGLAPEIALAWSGLPRQPLVDLTALEDGERFFRSVEFLNGSALTPNRVSCATCHPDGGSDGQTHPRNPPPMFGLSETAPFFWQGVAADLSLAIDGTFNTHSQFGGAPPAGSTALLQGFFESGLVPPPSPHLGPLGELTSAARAGQALFEGVAQCTACHVAPLFVPAAPDPPTIAAGVGTGLAPVNVPSLRGAWMTAPYFHDASAATLHDVLARDTGDLHGATSSLSPEQVEQLVQYLLSL